MLLVLFRERVLFQSKFAVRSRFSFSTGKGNDRAPNMRLVDDIKATSKRKRARMGPTHVTMIMSVSASLAVVVVNTFLVHGRRRERIACVTLAIHPFGWRVFNASISVHYATVAKDITQHT